jgi:hypothetical protein
MSEQLTYAVVIDPHRQQVNLHEIEGGRVKFEHMYKVMECSTIEIVELKRGIDLLCDEEASYIEDNPSYYIGMADDNLYHQIIGISVIAKHVKGELYGWTMQEVIEVVNNIKIKWIKN